MRRGLEHVSEVIKGGSCNSLSGKIIFINGLLIHLFRDEKSSLKANVTSLFSLLMEKHYVSKNSPNRTYATCIKMKPKDGISDLIIRTGDRLRRAISMLGLETNSTTYKGLCGDGVTVVLAKQKGSQESSIKKITTSVIKARGNPLMITKVKEYYPSLIRIRKISSSPLKDLETYKKAYEKMKSKPGNMTKGSDGKTIDGTSINKLEKLRRSIMD